MTASAFWDFFRTDGFMPHGMCLLWRPYIFWLHLVSDGLIAAAYYSIPFALITLVRKRKDLAFSGLFYMFGAFISLCGATHLMEIWTLWNPDYAVSGLLKLATAIVSVTTAISLWPLLPKALALPSASALERMNVELQKEVATRSAAEFNIRRLNTELEERVAARTQELATTNARLRAEIDERRAVEDRLHAVLSSALDGIATIDARGIIEFVNPACERIFGYSARELVGQNVKLLMPEPYHSEHDGYLNHHLTTGETRIIGTSGREVSGRRKDGSLFPIDLSIGTFALQDGRHFSGVIRDITQRKKAEDAVTLLATIVSTSDDPIISEMLDGTITSWNAAAERLLGYSASEAVGQNISIILPPERLDEEKYILGQVREGRPVEHFETVRIAKDGIRIDISATITPIRDKSGHIFGASKIIRDIRARKKADLELSHYVSALERSNKELDDFAYIASHDLKEPLRGLFNNAAFLLEDYQDKLAEDAVARLQRMSYLSQRMERLINDLLYFSRLGRQELAIQRTDLNAVIRDIELLSETTLQERNVTIIIPTPLPEIRCDKTRITEVFRNLIINAAKYNDKAEKFIRVGCIANMPTDNGPQAQVFYVEDNGIGIAKEFHDEIFRIFKRLNLEDDDKRGTGVGLTFVKKIIERHGGRIWLESAPGKGTTFYFTIGKGVAYDAN